MANLNNVDRKKKRFIRSIETILPPEEVEKPARIALASCLALLHHVILLFMKIGIIADSHDHVDHLEYALTCLRKEGIELLLHAGDYIAPFVLRRLLKSAPEFVGVFGNNDGDRVLLSKTAEGRVHPAPFELTLPEHRIMILHEPYGLEAIVKSGLYHLVVFGHTHEALLERHGGTLVINPGETGGWLYGRSTAALYDTENREGRILDL
ncbi:MAG: metallophosphoesterase [Deltaproteobacteria bacterium]|nr:metallophosphoesterase [Deltaproteobacteria bacterium]